MRTLGPRTQELSGDGRYEKPLEGVDHRGGGGVDRGRGRDQGHTAGLLSHGVPASRGPWRGLRVTAAGFPQGECDDESQRAQEDGIRKQARLGAGGLQGPFVGAGAG